MTQPARRRVREPVEIVTSMSWAEMLALLDWACQQASDAAVAQHDSDQVALWGLRRGAVQELATMFGGETFAEAVAPVEAWARRTLQQAGMPWPSAEEEA